MNSVFFSSQELSTSCLESDTQKGEGTSIAIVISQCILIILTVLVISLFYLSSC